MAIDVDIYSQGRALGISMLRNTCMELYSMFQKEQIIPECTGIRYGKGPYDPSTMKQGFRIEATFNGQGEKQTVLTYDLTFTDDDILYGGLNSLSIDWSLIAREMFHSFVSRLTGRPEVSDKPAVNKPKTKPRKKPGGGRKFHFPVPEKSP